jgi:hypothetical protein
MHTAQTNNMANANISMTNASKYSPDKVLLIYMKEVVEMEEKMLTIRCSKFCQGLDQCNNRNRSSSKLIENFIHKLYCNCRTSLQVRICARQNL